MKTQRNAREIGRLQKLNLQAAIDQLQNEKMEVAHSDYDPENWRRLADLDHQIEILRAALDRST